MSEAPADRSKEDQIVPLQGSCEWRRSEDGNDDTQCGGTWCLDDGTPPEHGMKFCPFCGGILVWHDFVPLEDNDDE